MNNDQITNLLSIVLIVMLVVLFLLVIIYFIIKAKTNPKKEKKAKDNISQANTKNNTVAWGTMSGCIGNNPIGLAVPGPNGRPNPAADLAMSQFSWGKLELAKIEERLLPMEGGYDVDGNATKDPVKIMESKCIMPMGLWKGSALSILLDLIAAGISGGKTVHQLSLLGDEQALSQVFIAINYRSVNDEKMVESTFEDTLCNLLSQKPSKRNGTVRYPGQASEQIRQENLLEGIPVDDKVWSDILLLG